MQVDFKEIKSEGGFDFERFTEDLLASMGWIILEKAGKGPDGGKDIIASRQEKHATGKIVERKYLIQCKHYAHSNKTVNANDLNNFYIMPAKHDVSGWLLVTSTIVSEDTKNNILAAEKSYPGIIFDYWDSRKIEEWLLLEKCRKVLRQYFPKSYSIMNNILIPALNEIDDLLREWNDKFENYKDNFVINIIAKQRLYKLIITNELTITTLRDLIFSENLLNDFLPIWNDKLSGRSGLGGIELLLIGLRRLSQLRKKSLPNDYLTEILIGEMQNNVFYREMKRKELISFSAYKGRDIDWTSFEIKQENSYISPLVAFGGILCGLVLIVYCENEGEAATGMIRIKDENKEIRFISSYQIESQIKIIREKIELPMIIEYKLDQGSDPVIYSTIGYAYITGKDSHGINVSWNILV